MSDAGRSCRCGMRLAVLGDGIVGRVWWCPHCDSLTTLVPGAARHPAGACTVRCLFCRNLTASVKRLDLRRWPAEAPPPPDHPRGT